MIISYLKSLLQESSISDLLVPMSQEEQEKTLSYRVDKLIQDIHKYLISKKYKLTQSGNQILSYYKENQNNRIIVEYTDMNGDGNISLQVLCNPGGIIISNTTITDKTDLSSLKHEIIFNLQKVGVI